MRLFGFIMILRIQMINLLADALITCSERFYPTLFMHYYYGSKLIFGYGLMWVLFFPLFIQNG